MKRGGRWWTVPASLGLVGLFAYSAACAVDSEPEFSSSDASQPASCPGFEAAGADEATDLRTGLRWETFVELSLLTHQQASERCAARGARLPTREEVLGLRSAGSTDGCMLPACPFRGDRCATVQCGSAVPGTDAHWGVTFTGGALVMVPAGQPEVSLCVRDPLPAATSP